MLFGPMPSAIKSVTVNQIFVWETSDLGCLGPVSLRRAAPFTKAGARASIAILAGTGEHEELRQIRRALAERLLPQL